MSKLSELSDSNFTIEYRTGISNKAADALSRNPEEDTSNSDIEDNHTFNTQHELLRIVDDLQHTLSLPSMLITAMDGHVQTKSVVAAIEEVQINSVPDLSPEHLFTLQMDDPIISKMVQFVTQCKKPTRHELRMETPQFRKLSAKMEATSTNGWFTLQKYNYQWFAYKSFSSSPVHPKHHIETAT